MFLQLLDMSKAFESVDWKKLMNILGSILTKCELHMMHVLINDVILNVKIGSNTGPDIHTNIEICQGDCVSVLLFILYLAFAANHYHLSSLLLTITSLSGQSLTEPSIEMYIRSLSTQSMLMHFIPEIRRVENQSSWKKNNSYVAHRSLACRRKQNGKVSHTKRWRKCLEKLQISRVTTWHRRSHQKAKRTFNWFLKTFASILSSKYFNEKVKTRVFATYIQSIFMYTSELQTETLGNSMDVFQRKLLRRIINAKRPRAISNKDIYARTEMKPCSVTVQSRRLTCFCHLMRIHLLKKHLKPSLILSKSLQEDRRRHGSVKCLKR